MGILVRQEKEKWLIELRETWKFKKGEGDFLGFHKLAEGLNMNYKVWFHEDSVLVGLENVRVQCENAERVKVLFEEFLELKKKHGQVKDCAVKRSNALRHAFHDGRNFDDERGMC